MQTGIQTISLVLASTRWNSTQSCQQHGIGEKLKSLKWKEMVYV